MKKDDALSLLKHEIDEIALQLSLGKAEAVDLVEEHKGELRELIDELRQSVDEGKVAGAESAGSLKQSLDEMRLQLALGKMQSTDALAEQREKFSAAFDSARAGIRIGYSQADRSVVGRPGEIDR